MTFGILEILALILVAIGTIKMITLAIKPDGWMNFAKSLYNNAKVLQIVFFILAAVVLYLLNLAGVGIITILAVMLFASFIYGMALAPYAKPLIKAVKPKSVLADNKLVVLVWVVLIVWGLKELFF